MKKSVFIWLFFFLLAPGAYTQIRFSDIYEGILAQEKDSFAAQDRWNIDLTYEHWTEKPDQVKQERISFGWGINRMFDFSLSRNNSFAFGLGIHWLNHYNNSAFNSVRLPGEPKKDTVAPFPASVNYKVNKYVLNFIDLNTELRLRFGRERNVKCYVGFRGSYLIGHHTKYKDASSKFKKYDIAGFSPFNYGPTIRLGLNNLSLYACYWLAPVYKNDLRQKITSLSVGLSLFIF